MSRIDAFLPSTRCYHTAGRSLEELRPPALEHVFRHELAFDRSSLTRWRPRVGEERLAALLRESLRVAHETGALATKDLERVVVDTTNDSVVSSLGDVAATYSS
jgi:hypothetical protein